MLGLQENASSSKEYRCMACSATFCGLASLLVHQATHAGSLPKTAQRPSDSNLVQASHPTFNTEENQSSLPQILPQPMYVCDCGQEFDAFTAMMAHKQSHASEGQSVQSVNLELPKEDSFNTQRGTTAAQTDVFGENSTAGLSIDEPSLVQNTTADINQEESAAVASTEGHSPLSAETDEQCDKTLSVEEMLEEMSEQTEGNDMDETVPKNQSLMKILASAYGKHLVSPQSVDNNNIAISIKEEPEVVVITPQTAKGPSTETDMSTMQLKRLLGKPGMKTKAPSISRLLESSTKKIVSLTKIFSPVVLLETRQKFMDPSSDTYGNYQCSRCRRVFQDVDSLTEHHFMHKKERIKCCRCCKQLIIGRVPLPDNHICPQSGGKITVSSVSFKSNSTNGQKTTQINSLNNRKKVYFCPICKHNYARRYNLKMHKCRGPVSSQLQQTTTLNNSVEASLSVQDECNNSQSVGVGTQVKSIKVEENEEDTGFQKNLSKSWGSPLSKEEQQLTSAFAASFLQIQDSSWSHAADNNEDASESRWTMPLNSDVDLLTAKGDPNVKDIGESVSVSQSDTRRVSRNYFIKDGVRRYPCGKCQQLFCSSCSLSRHEKLCSVNPKGLGNELSSNNMTINANSIKMYPCYVCGRNFNRKDNMMVHRKKCELRRTMIPNLASEINPNLPPSNASNTAQDQTQEEDEGSWSIMSLPSVLPRRVTCECGIGFTSPKLLLEHLQKHAQESYTCPTCGVTVKSWADYEIHLQLHMHPQHHKRSQPLLLRFKQPTVVQKMSEPVPDVPEKQPLHQESRKQQRKKQQRSICSKCGKSFASRCSLRRHISWNRCKALRTTFANKTYHCSLCNSDFPNAISLLFHQRGGTCKPAIKPVRCPICLRWFTTTDGLQKHLLAHKNSETFRCDVCQGTYPSLKSLKIHRRRIHRIMVRQANVDSMEQAFHGSVSGSLHVGVGDGK